MATEKPRLYWPGCPDWRLVGDPQAGRCSTGRGRIDTTGSTHLKKTTTAVTGQSWLLLAMLPHGSAFIEEGLDAIQSVFSHHIAGHHVAGVFVGWAHPQFDLLVEHLFTRTDSYR